MKMRYLLTVGILTVMALVLIGPGKAQALLMRVDVGSSFVVTDDVNDVQWADVTHFTDMTFAQVLAEIGNMNDVGFAGATDWHLASGLDLAALFDEIVAVGDARQFGPTLGGSSVTYAVSGRYDLAGSYSDSHYGANVNYNHHLADDSTELTKNLPSILYADDYTTGDLGAFVVSSNTVEVSSNPVPEPATLLMMGLGLMGVLGRRKR